MFKVIFSATKVTLGEIGTFMVGAFVTSSSCCICLKCICVSPSIKSCHSSYPAALILTAANWGEGRHILAWKVFATKVTAADTYQHLWTRSILSQIVRFKTGLSMSNNVADSKLQHKNIILYLSLERTLCVFYIFTTHPSLGLTIGKHKM